MSSQQKKLIFLGLILFFEIYLGMKKNKKLFVDLDIQGCKGQKQNLGNKEVKKKPKKKETLF